MSLKFPPKSQNSKCWSQRKTVTGAGFLVMDSFRLESSRLAKGETAAAHSWYSSCHKLPAALPDDTKVRGETRTISMIASFAVTQSDAFTQILFFIAQFWQILINRIDGNLIVKSIVLILCVHTVKAQFMESIWRLWGESWHSTWTDGYCCCCPAHSVRVFILMTT